MSELPGLMGILNIHMDSSADNQTMRRMV